MKQRSARIFFKKDHSRFSVKARLWMFKSRIKGDQKKGCYYTDTGNIWVLYISRETGWEQGSSHTGEVGDTWIWDILILRKERWQDELNRLEVKCKERVKDDYKILAWGIWRTKLPSFITVFQNLVYTFDVVRWTSEWTIN